RSSRSGPVPVPSCPVPVPCLALPDGAPLPPGDYSTTPGGTVFGTTPGGTRIIYDRKFLMECRNSPIAKTPPSDLPDIPGVTSPNVEELKLENHHLLAGSGYHSEQDLFGVFNIRLSCKFLLPVSAPIL
uniref:Eukaryotic translation initiation factor 4E binding protein 1 n=1 Tax=Malurus cyaneus samueli TaxID=2593467 RepID=A0A8C5UCH4_9PASS